MTMDELQTRQYHVIMSDSICVHRWAAWTPKQRVNTGTIETECDTLLRILIFLEYFAIRIV